MEVQGRDLQPALGTKLSRSRAQRFAGPLLGLTVVLAAAVYFLLQQPIGSPWWIYADADGTYTASSLNLLTGKHSRYVDHPGLPEQEVMGFTFGAQHLWDRATGGHTSSQAHADRLLDDLDATRTVFRGWAIAFYFFGVLLSYALVARLFGHWAWGVAGGLLWLGLPDLAPDSIQIRPDVLLSALCLLAGYLLLSGFSRRDALRMAAGAFVVGFATTAKLHAFGLVLPCFLAAVFAHPHGEWGRRLSETVTSFLRRRRVVPAAVAVLWLALAVATNWPYVPFTASALQRNAVFVPVLVVFGYAGLATFAHSTGSAWLARVLDPWYAVVAGCLVAGLLVPVTFFLQDGSQGIVEIFQSIQGKGVNRDIKAFTLDWHVIEGWPLKQGLVLFVLCGVGALVGLRRRTLWPALWFVGAAAMAFLAAIRLGAVRYFDPAYVWAIPGALWLLRERTRGAVRVVAVAALVTYVAWPSLRYAGFPSGDARVAEEWNAAAYRAAHDLLGPNEIALGSSYEPIADVRYWGLVTNFTTYTPATHPYTFLEDNLQALPIVRARNVRMKLFVGQAATSVTKPGIVTLDMGTFYARPVQKRYSPFFGVLELLSPPNRPDARWSTASNDFVDPAGHHYDVAGALKS